MTLLDYLKLGSMGAPAATAQDPSSLLAYMGQGGDLSDFGDSENAPGQSNVYPYAPGSANSALIPDSTTDLPAPRPGMGSPVSQTPTQGIWDRIKAGLSQPGVAQALIAGGARMLDQAGPQRMLVSTGQAVGGGLDAGMGAFSQFRQQQEMDAYRGTVANARQTQAQANLQRELNDASDKANKPPVLQRIESGNQIITQQMDPRDGSWKTIATAPRFEPKTAPQPSMSAVIAPILAKMASGQPLTPAEQNAFNQYKSISPIDQMEQQILSGGDGSQPPATPAPGGPAPQAAPAPMAPAPAPMQQPVAPQPGVNRPAPASAPKQYQSLDGKTYSGISASYYMVRDAKSLLQKGANPAAVRQRLVSYGIDPSQAGL